MIDEPPQDGVDEIDVSIERSSAVARVRCGPVSVLVSVPVPVDRERIERALEPVADAITTHVSRTPANATRPDVSPFERDLVRASMHLQERERRRELASERQRATEPNRSSERPQAREPAIAGGAENVE